MRSLAIIIGIIIFGADQITKGWVTRWVTRSGCKDPKLEIIEGFLTIDEQKNTGIAFGLWDDFESEWKLVILSGLALLAVIFVLYYIWTTPAGLLQLSVALGLLLGGILGNVTDRLLNGYVVDFIKVHWRDTIAWPTFNIADAAITCGVILIFLETFLGNNGKPALGGGASGDQGQERL